MHSFLPVADLLLGVVSSTGADVPSEFVSSAGAACCLGGAAAKTAPGFTAPPGASCRGGGTISGGSTGC